ncbi:ABC transporter ATP-binding protein [Phytohabitans flavus]|uniref:ABC transporter ATP-binding protein n=1 Tax=Phytohabitans flavus TaxID=1076124 RepID=UPI0031EAEEEC
MALLRGIPIFGHREPPRGDVESSSPGSGANVRLHRVTRGWPMGRGRRAGTVAAVEDVTLSITPGQAVAFAGPSGSGKSTLLRLASAQDRPDTGSVVVDGVRLEALSSRQATRFRRRIGVVSHDSRLMSALTAVENIMFPLLYQKVSFDPYERALHVLDAVGLAERAAAEVSDLSDGERQRVVLARALANRPRLVIADEPAAGLDHRAATEVLDLLKRMTGTYGMTLLLSTTDDAVAARCPRVVRLREGVVVDDTTADTGPAARDAARHWIKRSAPVF